MPQLTRPIAKVKEDKKEKSDKSTPTKKKGKTVAGKIDKSMISGPVSSDSPRCAIADSVQAEGSFKHVAHMGYDSQKGFASSGVDPSWQTLLERLSAQGVSAKQIQKNQKFIEDYVEREGGIEKVYTG